MGSEGIENKKRKSTLSDRKIGGVHGGGGVFVKKEEASTAAKVLKKKAQYAQKLARKEGIREQQRVRVSFVVTMARRREASYITATLTSSK